MAITNELQLPSAQPLLADYVSREELARALKVTTKTLDRWAWLSSGPAKVKIGSRVYYSREDVRAWLDAKRHAAQREAA